METCSHTWCTHWVTSRAQLSPIFTKITLLYNFNLIFVPARACWPVHIQGTLVVNRDMIVSRHNVWPNPWPAGEESQCHSNVIRSLHQCCASVCVCECVSYDIMLFCLIPNISSPVISSSLCGRAPFLSVQCFWSYRCSVLLCPESYNYLHFISGTVKHTVCFFFLPFTQQSLYILCPLRCFGWEDAQLHVLLRRWTALLGNWWQSDCYIPY